MKKGNPLFIVMSAFFGLIACAVIVALLWGLSGHSLRTFRWDWRGETVFRSGRAVLLEESSYALDGIDQLSVRMVSEDIRVAFTDAPEMTLRYYGIEGENIKVEQTGRRLEVTSPLQNRLGVSFGFTGDLRCEVELPYMYERVLSLASVSGTVTMGDGAAEYQALNLSATSGDIIVNSDVTAQSAAFSSISGNIECAWLTCGQASVSTTSGDIRFFNWEGAGRATSVSGHVDVAALRLTGDLSASTTSGDVDLTLAPGADFRFKANTVSGDIDANFPVTYEGWRKNKAAATVGSGANSVDISTISGEIEVNVS